MVPNSYQSIEPLKALHRTLCRETGGIGEISILASLLGPIRGYERRVDVKQQRVRVCVCVI